jgi:hypothetical protein
MLADIDAQDYPYHEKQRLGRLVPGKQNSYYSSKSFPGYSNVIVIGFFFM